MKDKSTLYLLTTLVIAQLLWAFTIVWITRGTKQGDAALVCAILLAICGGSLIATLRNK